MCVCVSQWFTGIQLRSQTKTPNISVSHSTGATSQYFEGRGEEEVKDKKLQFEVDMIIYLKNKMKDESLTMVLDIKLE